MINTRLLSVYRTLSSGEKVLIGKLAGSQQGMFFAYADSYLASGVNLSPFMLHWNGGLQKANSLPHGGLHGVFSDCLPDGWGMLVQDRYFTGQGLHPRQLTALDRLAFIGDRAIGALSFCPSVDYEDEAEANLGVLGEHAEALYDGLTDEVLMALVGAGSSGGARPKAQIYMPKGDTNICRTVPQDGDEGWIVKFTSANLALGHEEGVMEAVYLSMAKKAGLEPVDWQLLRHKNRAWLAVKRFDYLPLEKPLALAVNPAVAGRQHVHSLCGLLDASHQMPSMTYGEMIKAAKLLCKDAKSTQLQFRRALFNLFAVNQDDHTKNWAFIQDDKGAWQPSPAYDVTYSPMAYAEHSMAFGRYGKAPPKEVIEQMAILAGFDGWDEVRDTVAQVADTVADFSGYATALGVKPAVIRLVQKQLNATYAENRHLLV